MLNTLALLTAAFVPQGQGSSTAPVVINEFSYDDSGTDDREYAELYNRSGAAVDISGWTLTNAGPGGTLASFAVPPATALAAGGYWVMGSNIVPNVNQVIGTTLIFGDGPNTLTLLDGSAAIVDTVGYEMRAGIFNAALVEGAQGIWGNKTSVDGHEQSWSRLVDGYDDDSNARDFFLLPATPGAPNGVAGVPALFENYDALVPDNDIPGWSGSFYEPKAVDVTLPGVNNPNAIPVSPQGGQAGIHWDPTGGGNYTVYPTPIGPGQVFEAWVYLDAVPELAGEHETWSIGFGSSGTYFNVPDPGGVLGTTFNANTGVNWTYQVTAAGGTLYLVDNNDGGWAGAAITTPNVITQIPITTGVNDGWRRLKLEVLDMRLVIAQFDGGAPIIYAPLTECCNAGCFPCGDGANCPSECMDPTLARDFDYFWIGYREFVSNNTGARPPTLDDLVVRPSSANLAYLGTSAPSTVGTPVIAANSPPLVGNPGFALGGFNLSGGLALFVGSFSTNTLNLALLGGQPGAAVLNGGSLFIQGAAGGQSSLPIALPNNPALGGLQVYWQVAEIDPALAFAIQVANSRILETTLGFQ